MTFCPEHSDCELRIEYTGETHTGFCLKYLKHYKMCRATNYMSSCNKLKGHEGLHQTDKGIKWEGKYK